MHLNTISFTGFGSCNKNIFLSSSTTANCNSPISHIDATLDEDEEAKMPTPISTICDNSSQTSFPATFSSFTPATSSIASPSSYTSLKLPDIPLYNIYSMDTILNSNGYTLIEKVSETLQGSIWKLKNTKKERYVVKIAEKSLHRRGSASINGKEIRVQEDIIKEMKILKYLTNNSNNVPNGIITYIDFFEDEMNYFLILQDGGDDLFTFIKKAHILIEKGKLSMAEWHSFCKNVIKQMIQVIDWMHNKMHLVHFDISLENFVISPVVVQVLSDGRMSFMPNFTVKIIDFGIAEIFSPKQDDKGSFIDYKCNKFVGKPRYQSPEILDRIPFDARTADCWSLGVTIFSMITGAPPFNIAHKDDIYYEYIICGHLHQVLGHIDRISYVNKQIFDLIVNIFKPAQDRININKIKMHQWFT